MKLSQAFKLHKLVLALSDKEAASVLYRILDTNPTIVERAMASEVGEKEIPEDQRPIWRAVINAKMENRIGTIKQAREVWSLGLAEAKAWTEGVASIHGGPPPGVIIENVSYADADIALRKFDALNPGVTKMAIIKMSDPWEFIKGGY